MEIVNDKKYKTFYDVFFEQKNIFLDIALMGFAVVFLAILANIRVPIWPVPITMQTFGIFLIAFFFGSRKGVIAIALYIMAGLVGFGVFAGYKSGIGAVIGPTGGYIAGFLLAAYVVGSMIEKGHGRTKSSVLKILILGNLIIYGFGLIGLVISFENMGIWQLLMVGVIPFLIGDILKIGAAMVFFPWLWNASEKIK